MQDLFVSDKHRVEGEALRQLERVRTFEGMEQAVGLPDLHPGLGIPLGMACMAKGIVYPHLLGTDVGCGVAMWRTSLLTRKQKLDKVVKKIPDLDDPWDGDTQAWLEEAGIEASEPDPGLGTLGGGNHFAELQAVSEIVNPEKFEALGLEKQKLTLVVHTGSRGKGAFLYRNHTEVHGAGGLDSQSAGAQSYIQKHDLALAWGKANRSLVAHRFLESLGADSAPVLDLCHNMVSPMDGDRWLHRKGAGPADQGPIIIPGSRDALTYLVVPTQGQEKNLWSLPHGAGRKWKRSECKKRLSTRYTAKSMTRTSLGGRVICKNKALLFEEAPQAYKSISLVIQDLLDFGLVDVVATYKPLVTYKTRQAN